MRTAQDAKLSCITRQPIPEYDNTQDARNTRPNRAKHMPTRNGPREWTEKGFQAPADEATAIDKNRADKREQTRCNRWRGAHYGSVVLVDIPVAQHPPFFWEPWRPFSLAPLFISNDSGLARPCTRAAPVVSRCRSVVWRPRSGPAFKKRHPVSSARRPHLAVIAWGHLCRCPDERLDSRGWPGLAGGIV